MYLFTQAQMTLISQTAADPNPPGGNARANMYDLIHQIIQQPDAFGNTADVRVVAWFGAAAQANRGEGGASDLIRDYTHAQLLLRSGSEISNISSVLQNASNAIADAVLADIRESIDTVSGEKYYGLPALHEIGEKDAAKTLEQLAMFSSAPGIWSGNPLFIGLGDSSFWQGTILGDTTDTYDLAVSIKSLIYSGIRSIPNMIDLVSLWWGQGGEGRGLALQNVAQAISSTDTFLQNAYGQYGVNLINLSGSMLVLGSEGDDSNLDQGIGLTADALIHGGSGNDHLYGSSGSDTLDGGTGEDYVSFESGSRSGEYSSLTASILDVQSDADFSALVKGVGTSSAVFNAEDLTLGRYDDTLSIYSLAPGATSLSLVSGADHGEKGDTIDLSELTSNTGAVITLQGAESGAGIIRVDLSQIAVDSFENVIGSEKNDSIKGSEETNVIQGGDGDDTIDGGGGADLLAGGAGADTLNVNLSGASGPVIVWGGGGADTLSITTDGETQLGIMMVNVTDLTEENFNQLSLDALKMPDDFDWSKIGTIVVNAESDDDITYNGQSLRGHEETVMAQDRVWYTVSTDNPHPSDVAWGNALIAAGYEVAFESTFTFPEENPDMGGSYHFRELVFEAETSETYMAIGNQEEGPFWEVNRVQGSFLSGSQNFHILSPAVFRPVIAVSQDTESDYNSINRDLPVNPILVTSTISYSFTPPGADEPIDASFVMEFYHIGFHASPDGWQEEPGGIFIPPDPDSYAVSDFYYGYMTSEEIVFNTAETIGEWFVAGGMMDENGGIISDGTITVSLGEDPVAVAAARHDFL